MRVVQASLLRVGLSARKTCNEKEMSATSTLVYPEMSDLLCVGMMIRQDAVGKAYVVCSIVANKNRNISLARRMKDIDTCLA